VFLIDADRKGIDWTNYRTIDGRPASNLTFNSVQVPSSEVLGTVDQGVAPLRSTLAMGIAGLAAEALGCMEVLIDSTTDYVKQRKQFGVPIGSFQVLQHRLVDMVIAREHARSITYMLTGKLQAKDGDAATAAAATKAAVGQHGRFVGGQAVHLHGGMGMTDELPIGDYFKRLMMIDTTFGDAHYHRRDFARRTDERNVTNNIFSQGGEVA
jgi:alkylation response protein AidB-like acyl-CoA dehydrogenase